MRRISIGSWAYTIGPYADKPIDFDTVCTKLKELGYDGVELGGFKPHPNPDDCPEKSQRDEIVAKMVEGRLRKYYEEVVLLDQIYVIDGETKVRKAVEAAAAEIGAPVAIAGFVRFVLGEGVAREETGFAAEVAATARG